MQRTGKAGIGRGAAPGAVLFLALVAMPATASSTELVEAAMQRDMERVAALLDRQVAVDDTAPDGTAALHWLVRYGAHELVERALAAGADPDRASRHGVRPLALAIAQRDLESVRLLLAAGADPDAADAQGESALFHAARAGDAAVLEHLLAAGAEPDRRDLNFGQTALMVAVRSGHPALAERLIAAGADVDAQSRTGETPAFRRPEDSAASRGVGVNRGGWPSRGERDPVPGAKTALLYATRLGDLASVRLLVEAGADIELADANGVTPLLNAIINKSVAVHRGGSDHLRIAAWLVEQGADVNAADWYGQAPLWAAVNIRNLDVSGPTRDNRIDRAQALDLIDLLLARGADPNARLLEYIPQMRFINRLGSLEWVELTGQTPFVRAALAGDTTVMERLLAQGADPNIPTHNGTTALMVAAGVNWTVSQTFDEGEEQLLRAVKMAFELGNDVNAVNTLGMRAIHGAANRGSNDIIRFLAEHGADLNAVDGEGRDPVAWAEGVFLATHPPVRKPDTIALLQALRAERTGAVRHAD